MIIKRAKVFIYNNDIESRKVLGNPATVIILENKDKLNKQTKKEIAIKENQPITSFVKHIKNNEFNIEYFFPNGDEVNFCGHGTLAASKIVKDYYNLKNEIIFHFNKKLFKEKIDNTISVTFNERNLFTLTLNRYNIAQINNIDINNMILEALSLSSSELDNIYFCESLNDFIIKLKDVNLLRTIKINKNKFNKLSNILKFRALTITSKSNNSEFDYEARVFSASLKDCEDIVCGSSSCYLSNLWFNILKKKNINALFPYKHSKKYFGGVEFLEILNDSNLKLSGYVK